jgi:hypothetical protein
VKARHALLADLPGFRETRPDARIGVMQVVLHRLACGGNVAAAKLWLQIAERDAAERDG